MQEHETLAILSDLHPRMPGASPDLLAGPVTRAWNAHHIGQRTMPHAQRAVIDAVWKHGYRRGASLGHQTAAGYWQQQARDALSRLTALSARSVDIEGARQILTITMLRAAAVSAALPRPVDTGPGEQDYLTARADHNDLSAAGRLAAAALVGWTHSLRAGYDDAAAAATQDIVDSVIDLVGEGTVLRTRVDLVPAPEWLSNTTLAALQQPIPTDPATARPPAPAGSFKPLSVGPGFTASPGRPAVPPSQAPPSRGR